MARDVRQQGETTTERLSLVFYRHTFEPGSLDRVVDEEETAFIESDQELYSSVIARIRKSGQLVPVDEVISQLAANAD